MWLASLTKTARLRFCVRLLQKIKQNVIEEDSVVLFMPLSEHTCARAHTHTHFKRSIEK